MRAERYRYVFLGRSVTSSRASGHAATYRALLRMLAARGHDVTFLERDLPSDAGHRDLTAPTFARTHLYASLEELKDRFADKLREADLVVVGSNLPDAGAVGAWALGLAHQRTAYYDLDPPGATEGAAAELVARHPLFLSANGGPTLHALARTPGAVMVRPLYPSVDPELYHPEPATVAWDLGHLGAFRPDRHVALDRLLFSPARRWPDGRFAVAGSGYPDGIEWPPNVDRGGCLSPDERRRFYNAQRFALNVTCPARVAAGWSPSVRLFEAAACGTPVVSDPWPGLADFFTPGREILVADSGERVAHWLQELGEERRAALGAAARARVLGAHTAMHRAFELEGYTRELFDRQALRRGASGRLSSIPGVR